MGDPSRLLCRPAVWQAKWADFSARHARQLARLHGSRPRTLANAAADLSAVFAVSSRRSAAALDARFRFRLEKPRTRPMPFQPATASCRPRLAKQPGLLSSMWNLGYPAGLGEVLLGRGEDAFAPATRRRPIPFPARETSDTPDAVSTCNSLLQAPVGKATGATLFDVELGLSGWGSARFYWGTARTPLPQPPDTRHPTQGLSTMQRSREMPLAGPGWQTNRGYPCYPVCYTNRGYSAWQASFGPRLAKQPGLPCLL
jgi:hypothetical protein